MKYVRLSCILTGIFLAGGAAAQETELTLDQVVVTATKFDKKSSETGKVVRVIDSEELEKYQGRSLVDLLNDQAGMVINNTYGPMGSNISYYMRGAASKYTSVQIDGIPVADPSAFTTFFDLNTLSLDQVERVEILRGASSTLHGSGAVAGVINIITKKGGSKAISLDGVLSGGSYDTYRGNANLSGNLAGDVFDYNIGYSYLDSKGFSSAAPVDTGGEDSVVFDKDGFKQQALNANFSIRPVENLTIKPFLRYSGIEYGYDGGAFTDAPNAGDNRMLQTGLGIVKYMPGRGQWVVSYALADFNRKLNEQSGADMVASDFDGVHHNAETYFNYRLSEKFQFIAGADFNALQTDAVTPFGGLSSDSAKMNYGSLFGSVFFSDASGFNLEIGGRFNHHSLYGNNATYTFNPSFLLNEHHKVFANIASAFRVPALDELYASYGSTSLEPERSQSYELGYEGVFAGKRLKLAVTGFVRDIKDVITFGPEFRYINFDRQKDHGLEAEAKAILTENLELTAFYAFADGELTQSDTTYNNLYKRPRHSAGLRLGYQLSPEFYIAVNSRYMGERTDLVFTPAATDKELESFILLDLYAQYRFGEHFKLFADLKNLTDAGYIESTGYNTRGFNFNAGLSFSF